MKKRRMIFAVLLALFLFAPPAFAKAQVSVKESGTVSPGERIQIRILPDGEKTEGAPSLNGKAVSLEEKKDGSLEGEAVIPADAKNGEVFTLSFGNFLTGGGPCGEPDREWKVKRERISAKVEANADLIAGDEIKVTLSAPSKFSVSGWIALTGDGVMEKAEFKTNPDGSRQAVIRVPECGDLAKLKLDWKDARIDPAFDFDAPETEFTFHRAPESADIVLETTNPNKGYVKDGDTVSVSVRTEENVEMILDGSTLEVENRDGVKTAQFPAERLPEGKPAAVEVRIYDRWGNDPVSFMSDAVTRLAGPEVLNEQFSTTNPSPGFVKNGDTAELSLEFSHDVHVKAVIFGQEFEQTGSSVSIKATVPEGLEDGSKAGYRWEGSDAAGNSLEGAESKPLVYLAPLKAEEILIASSNPNPALVREGDTVTLSFRTNHEACTDILSIDTQQLEAQTGTEFGGTVKALVREDGSKTGYSAALRDAAGNELEISDAPLTFYARIYTDVEAVFSDNKNPALLKDGDTVSVRFKANHDVDVEKAVIAGRECAPASGSEFTFEAEARGLDDMAPAAYIFEGRDAAGNTFRLEGSGLKYYAPIAVSGTAFENSNAKSKDCFKTGDLITLSFSTNHQAMAEGEVAGVRVSASDESEFRFSAASFQLEDGEKAGYRVSIEDAAGNTAEISADRTFTYLAPFSAGASFSGQFSKTEGYLKEGDRITAELSPGHEAEVTRAGFSGVEASTSGKTVSAEASGFPQGPVTFEAVLEDAAGNTAEVSRETGIIYDSIAPVVTLTPHVTMPFSNQNVTVTADIQDSALDAQSVRILVNGNNVAAKAGENGLRQDVTVTEENSYTFDASAEDKAGNRTEVNGGKTLSVIIDKTDPSVTSIEIDSENPGAYKSGLKLSDLVDVQDKYLKEIRCGLSDLGGNGSLQSIGIDDPITEEGLKQVEITGVDMADNRSAKTKLRFYIDGTAPKPVLTSDSSVKPVEENGTLKLSKGEKASLELDKIWMGSEAEDRLTRAEIVNKDGSRTDLLKGAAVHKIDVNPDEKAGRLEIEAVDDVGNATGTVTYYLSRNPDGTVKILSSDQRDEVIRTGSAIGIAAVAAAGAVLGAVYFVFVRRKKNRE